MRVLQGPFIIMTNFSKVLTVLITLACLGFAGFATMTTQGWDARWQGERDYVVGRSTHLGGNVIEFVPGEEKSFWVSRKSVKKGDKIVLEDFKTAPTLPEVLIATLEQLKGDLTTELEAIKPQIEPVKLQLARAKNLVSADSAALEAREEQLSKLVAARNNALVTAQKLSDKVGQEALRLRTVADLRREDVFRLRQLLDEVRTELFQLKVQKRQLQDELLRINGVLNRVRRRHGQLTDLVDPQNDAANPQPPAPPKTTGPNNAGE
jgi:ABC-type transporter Mla subunit MlaD